MIGSGDVIGVAPAPEYTFRILVTPVGPYFKGGLKPSSCAFPSMTVRHRTAPVTSRPA